jgi:hypothetical protein
MLTPRPNKSNPKRKPNSERKKLRKQRTFKLIWRPLLEPRRRKRRERRPNKLRRQREMRPEPPPMPPH